MGGALNVSRSALALAAAAALLAFSSRAGASGLYFTDRGVRPMGRAGAFVAGADDLGAVWYNPAGLADAGTTFLADFSWLHFEVDYTRRLAVPGPGGAVLYPQDPTMHGAAPVLPLPTIAASLVLDRQKKFTLAGGLLAPYIALASYPDALVYPDGTSRPSPARFTLSSYDGSLLALPGAWIAYKPIESLRVGLGLMALTGVFQARASFSACPQDRLLCAPEQQEYIANGQMRMGPIFAPTASAGVTWVPAEMVRLGVSGQLPMVVSSHAQFQVQLPSSSVFDSATQDGTDAHVRFVLPAVVRAGVEVRPVKGLRAEAAWVHEFWSAHQAIEVYPEGISIAGVTGLPSKLVIPPIVIPRNFRDSDSFRVGGEYFYEIGGYRVATRAGLAYETSAVPPGYLSISSLDFEKWIASIGGSLYIGKRWRFDAVWAHVFAKSVDVDPNPNDPGGAQIPRINPLPGNAPLEPVNGGYYAATADVIGVGLEYRF